MSEITSDWPHQIHEIDEVYFPFDSRWHRIGISISGGADSALLGFLLCSLISDKKLDIEIHVITNIRMWKTRPWQRYNSIDVYMWLKNKFKDLQFYRHENFISPELEYGNIGPIIKDQYGNMKSGDQINTRSYAEFVCHTNKIEAWFSAITKNAPEDFSSKGMPDRNVDKFTDLKSIVNEHEGLWVCHPFRFTTKDWIVKQYKNNNILDLFYQTRSCEGDFDFLNYKNYIPGQSVPECGNCYWCQERHWAIEKNDL